MIKFQEIFTSFPTVKKCDFDRQFLSDFIKFYNNGGIQKLKPWCFGVRKNYFCILNIKRSRAVQSLITLFLFTHRI